MFKIKKELFLKNYKKNIPQIIKHQIIADTETPVSALLKIFNKEKYSFLLESVEGGDQRGRFSLLGGYPDLIWTVYNGKVKIEKLNKNSDISKLKKNKRKVICVINKIDLVSKNSLLNILDNLKLTFGDNLDADIIAPPIITDEIALVTDIKGVCNEGVTLQTT